jgi:hypothetical protein
MIVALVVLAAGAAHYRGFSLRLGRAKFFGQATNLVTKPIQVISGVSKIVHDP